MNLKPVSRVPQVVIFLMVWLCAASTVASAQIRFGFAGGLNYTSLKDVRGAIGDADARAVYESHVGWHAGVFVDLAAGFIAIRPGLYYVDNGPLFQDGFPSSDEVVGGFPAGDPNLDPDDFNIVNIAIPIDVRLRLSLPIIKPYVFGGPEIRVLEDGNIGTFFSGNLKRFTYGLNVGFGAEINLLGIQLMPELRYALDSGNLTEDEINFRGVTFIPDAEHKAKTIALRLGILF